jgi:2-phosphosulfolactate phosphatase
MPHLLNAYALPAAVRPVELAGGTVVVIDVLRASTTIVHALEAGAAEVIPCQEVNEARTVAAGLPRDSVILGGERRGLPIEGFDLGNSPEEYLRWRVAGKSVVFTTTNGTQAIFRARQAERILIGAFVNASAAVERLLGEEQIHLLCAGTRGQPSRDDVLLAGRFVDRILRQSSSEYRPNAQALRAREAWLRAFPQSDADDPQPQQLAEQLRDSAGGRNLMTIGRDADILAAAQIDRFRSVPEMDREKSRIRLM